MSFISHDLKGAVVTWKDDTYEPSICSTPRSWPFAEDVTQATVVAVYTYTERGVVYDETMLVLKAPNGDLAEFVGRGARVVGGRDSKACEAVHSRLSNRLFKHINKLEGRVEALGERIVTLEEGQGLRD